MAETDTTVSRSLSAIDKEIKGISTDSKSATKESNLLQQSLSSSDSISNLTLMKDRFANIKDQISLCSDKVAALKQKQELLKEAGVSENSEEFRKLQTQIDLTNAKAATLKESLLGLDKTSLNNLSASLAKIGAVAISAIAGIVALTKKAADTGYEIQKMVDLYGGTAEDFQLISNAFEKVTNDADSYKNVLSATLDAQSEAQKGTWRIIKNLQMIGLSVNDIKGLSASEALAKIEAGLAGVSNEGDRLAIATALLGTAGQNVVQYLSLSSDELATYNENLTKSGLVSDEEVEKSAVLKNELSDMQKTLSAIAVQIGTALTPMIKAFGNLLSSMSPIFDTVAKVLDGIGSTGQAVLAVILSAIALLPILAAAIKVLNTVMNANPIFAILTAVATLVNLIIVLFGLLHKNVDSKYGEMAYSANLASATAENISNQVYNNSSTTNSSSTTTNNITINASSDSDLDSIMDAINRKSLSA